MRILNFLISRLLLPSELYYLSSWMRDGTSAKCKATPDSTDWPSKQQWAKLNSSLSGKLLSAVAPGAVCHRDQATFDKTACKTVASQWTSSAFHSSLPVSIDYNDDTCFPNASAPCSIHGYPPYIVNASSAADVKRGVDFAREHNIRLTVKGTGHDFNGRSSAPNSLAIWTHYIRGIEFYESFTTKGCNEDRGTPAAKISAGMQMAEIQEAAARQNVMVVGGADPDVGIGGFLLGGGHSPISSMYGLGADQVLEFEVVTPTGEILTVNECNYKDLFWTLRGGGPSFAVLVSATVKTYPTKPFTVYLMGINTTSNSETYWNSNAYFHSQIPHLSDRGAMGYYFAFAKAAGVLDSSEQGQIVAAMLVMNKSTAEADAIFKPMREFFTGQPFADKTNFIGRSLYVNSFYDWYKTVPRESVGSNGRLGSRLLDREALTSNLTALGEALKQASHSVSVLLGHMVAGKGVRDAQPAGGGDAVNPAWRRAYTHVVVPVDWPLLDEKAKKASTYDLTYKKVAALRELAPHMGAYMSEADPDEPNWQESFWGDHYLRLLRIKEKYDPHGVMYCFPCVGGDKWKIERGHLCRV